MILAKTTYFSLASNFIPSSNAPVTFVFKYRRVESPCGDASEGIVKPGSGCAEAALEPCAGVPVRPGAGLGAKVAGAGDCERRSADQRSSVRVTKLLFIS